MYLVCRLLLEKKTIAAVASTGGSIHEALHIHAMPRPPGLRLKIEDFAELSLRTRILADVRPGGRYDAPAVAPDDAWSRESNWIDAATPGEGPSETLPLCSDVAFCGPASGITRAHAVP